MNIYDKAVSLLKIRPHHSGELAKKLLLRKFNREEVEAVINKLTEEGLLDNKRFAQNFLDNLIKYKTLGFNGLKFRLIKRGIASNEAEELVRENFSLDQEKASAQKYLQTARTADKKKLAYGLSSRGFRSSVIREVLGL